MFRGRYEHAIDGKGRVGLPARFREAMAGQEEVLVITTSDDPCLVAYTKQAFLEFEQKLTQKNGFNPAVRRLIRRYVGSAHDCPIDGMGRVLLPMPLREHAGIAKEVTFLGQINVIEIWSKDGWEKAQDQMRDRLSTDLQALSDPEN